MHALRRFTPSLPLLSHINGHGPAVVISSICAHLLSTHGQMDYLKGGCMALNWTAFREASVP